MDKHENVKTHTSTHFYNKYEVGDERKENIQIFGEIKKLDYISQFIYVFFV